SGLSRSSVEKETMAKVSFSGSEGRGRRFEFCRVHQFFNDLVGDWADRPENGRKAPSPKFD
ncbi:MAG: hypothetical protein K2X59_12385, partial [Sphingomonas sp.]|nr:hypothetical protein [Sphingomonas sp.]